MTELETQTTPAEIVAEEVATVETTEAPATTEEVAAEEATATEGDEEAAE